MSDKPTFYVTTSPGRIRGIGEPDGYLVELWRLEPHLCGHISNDFWEADGEPWKALGIYPDPEAAGFPPPGECRPCTIELLKENGDD